MCDDQHVPGTAAHNRSFRSNEYDKPRTVRPVPVLTHLPQVGCLSRGCRRDSGWLGIDRVPCRCALGRGSVYTGILSSRCQHEGGCQVAPACSNWDVCSAIPLPVLDRLMNSNHVDREFGVQPGNVQPIKEPARLSLGREGTRLNRHPGSLVEVFDQPGDCRRLVVGGRRNVTFCHGSDYA